MTSKMKFWYSLFQYYRHLSKRLTLQRYPTMKLQHFVQILYLNPSMKNYQGRFPGGGFLNA